MSVKILYLPKNFIPPQNRFLATPLVRPTRLNQGQGQGHLTARKWTDVPRSVHHDDTAEVAVGESHQDGPGTVDVVAEQHRHRPRCRLHVTQHEERNEEDTQKHWYPHPLRCWLDMQSSARRS